MLVVIFLLIPLYLAVVALSGNVMEAGQSGSGLAGMLGVHYFEHVLDYLFVALLSSGLYGALLAPNA